MNKQKQGASGRAKRQRKSAPEESLGRHNELKDIVSAPEQTAPSAPSVNNAERFY
jgi:hypothetical protein